MELRAQSCGYLHGHEVGGTNPSLVEALGCGNMIFALNVPYNAEVIADAGVLFDKTPGDLRDKLQHYLAHPEIAHSYGEKARARVHTIYNWDRIAEQHAAFFHRILKEHSRL
jgi:glycosyltransferase involved in cell wall biosynthesis